MPRAARFNPKEVQFTSQIFDLYRPWLSAGGRHDHEGHGTPMATEDLLKRINITDGWRFDDRERDMVSEHRRSVARGEGLFNNPKVAITGVAGLNDYLKVDRIDGFCGTSPRLANYRPPFC